MKTVVGVPPDASEAPVDRSIDVAEGDSPGNGDAEVQSEFAVLNVSSMENVLPGVELPGVRTNEVPGIEIESDAVEANTELSLLTSTARTALNLRTEMAG
jgi:hypothetical protein